MINIRRISCKIGLFSNSTTTLIAIYITRERSKADLLSIVNVNRVE